MTRDAQIHELERLRDEERMALAERRHLDLVKHLDRIGEEASRLADALERVAGREPFDPTRIVDAEVPW